MAKPRNEARLSPCEAFWQKHNGFLCEKPILPCEHSATDKTRVFVVFGKPNVKKDLPLPNELANILLLSGAI